MERKKRKCVKEGEKGSEDMGKERMIKRASGKKRNAANGKKRGMKRKNRQGTEADYRRG